MATTHEIKVPPLGESVQEATLVGWLKKVGDPVIMDETIAELETDKVTLEINAPATGTLKTITKEKGATVKVGEVLGSLVEEAQGTAKGASGPLKKASASSKEENPTEVKSSSKLSTTPSLEINLEKLAPSVRKIAKENQIDLSKIQGRGKEGRILKGDILESPKKGTDSQSVGLAFPQISLELPAPSITLEGDKSREERVKMTRLRQTIATRLKEAQNTAAMLTTFNEIDMSHVIAARAYYKEVFEKKHGVKLGFMSFFVKACVVALKEIPAINAEIEGDELIYKNYYDIGVAVSTPQGLVVPVIRDADKLGFSQIEKTISDLSQRAREGGLSIRDLTGGTFTITNGGIFGSLMSTPILNPPQSGILGMHKIQERPVAVQGEVKICPMMYVALTYDHRVIDGREAVTFLVRVKECLENPERILLDI